MQMTDYRHADWLTAGAILGKLSLYQEYRLVLYSQELLLLWGALYHRRSLIIIIIKLGREFGKVWK